MRLVEAVTGEFLHQVEDVAGQVLVDALARTPFHEAGALLGHLFRLLLAHRAAQHVGLTQRIAGQHLRDLHDLLLVENHAIGIC